MATFDDAIDALRAALHALHADDLSSEFLTVPSCRIAIVRGVVSAVTGPALYRDATGAAFERAARIVSRADAGGAVLETSLYAGVRAQIEGFADIEVSQPRKGRIPGLNVVSTVSIKPLGLRPERERDYIDVDEELRARPRR